MSWLCVRTHTHTHKISQCQVVEAYYTGVRARTYGCSLSHTHTCTHTQHIYLQRHTYIYQNCEWTHTHTYTLSLSNTRTHTHTHTYTHSKRTLGIAVLSIASTHSHTHTHTQNKQGWYPCGITVGSHRIRTNSISMYTHSLFFCLFFTHTHTNRQVPMWHHDKAESHPRELHVYV